MRQRGPGSPCPKLMAHNPLIVLKRFWATIIEAEWLVGG
jgi:hypothetical protein